MNKNIFKTIIIILLISIFIYPGEVMAQPEVSAEAAVLMDENNGQVLYEKNADKVMYPASTTKILTALVVINNSNLEDRVKVSHEAAAIGGSHVGLQEGEELKLEDLLYILLLSSANDAAVALAEHTGGSVEHFAEMMNAEAKALGAVHSHFTNPHGLPDPNHYTTAGDLALIAREAMKNPEFRKIVGTYHYRVERVLPNPVEGVPQVDFINHNKLIHPDSIYRFGGADGIKTGYTEEAEQCLVASAQKEGRQFISVVLKDQSPGLYTDSAALLNYGFNDFRPVVLAEAGANMGTAPVKRGLEDSVGVVTAEKSYIDLPAGGDQSFEKQVNIDKSVAAPVKKGQQLGEVKFIRQGAVIGTTALIADRDVDKKPAFRWWYGLIVLSLLPLVTRFQARSRRRRYLMRKKRWAR